MAFLVSQPLPNSRAKERRCGRVLVMRANPPKGSKSRRRQWHERQLDRQIEGRENEIPSDYDVFKDSPLDGSDDKARQKFYYVQALREEKKENFRRSIALLEKCVEIDITDTFSWMALARVTKEVEPLSVPDVFEKALAACPVSVHLHHAYGVYLDRIGKANDARSTFEKAYSIEPGNCYVCQSWGLLEQRAGNAARARELFQKAIADNPNTDVCVALAKLESEEGDLEQSRQKFELALSLATNPAKESDACRAWGQVEEKFGNLERAEKLLVRSFRARPNEETIVVLAKLKMRNGNAPGSLRMIRSIERPRKQWPSVAAMNVWASLEAKAGNFEDALRVIRLAIHRYANDSGLYLTWGTLEDKQGNIEGAIEQYKKSIEVRPNGPAFVALAVAEEKRGNFEYAREALEKSLEENPRHDSAYNALGLLEMARGNIDRSREVFEKGLAECPTSSVLHGAALLDLHVGEKEAAREKLERGLRLTREDTSWLWHTLGMLELRAGQARKAKKLFQEAIKRYPQSSVLLVGYALSVAATLPKGPDQDKEVRALFRSAVEVDKYHPQAWQCWGVFEYRQGEVELATKLFKAGLRFAQQHAALWQAWGVLETEKGNIFSARSIFERGNSFCPKDVHLLQAWACMEVRARNIQRARELLRSALAVDDTSGPCYNALALLESRHGDIDAARQIFLRGITMAPQHPPLYRTYAEVEVRQRNYSRARELFEKGLQIDPTYAPLLHKYAELEGLLGNLEGLNNLQRKMSAMFEAQQSEPVLDENSSQAIYMRMEEPSGDYEPDTFMETSIAIEQKRAAAEEELKRSTVEEFRKNPSSRLQEEDDSDLDDDGLDDEDDEDEYYYVYEDDDDDDTDWEESDVELEEMTLENLPQFADDDPVKPLEENL
ncbi:hypothetical protein NDN08_000462 [Rhodosorus marinus]|uniref:Pre-mRNA-splicing factor Syf1/CRNKL1-like C-terminal HAT-repeats domain-containing protein n=1 Tax=Rhodosorus marinus TaxID=101924 RepID=A0AAV8UR18_9RHOD|nr:hypothetical protein NDN08_000462 [Rhodosorus marinus]